MDVKIASDWKEILSEEFEKPYFRELTDFVRQEYASRRIFPRGSNIFRAFDKCPFDKLKVVIIGQDPNHGEGQGEIVIDDNAIVSANVLMPSKPRTARAAGRTC